MASSRRDQGHGKRGSGRDGSGFVALPHLLLDSPAFIALSFSARALLLDLARQYRPGRNGQLLCSAAHLRTRGWVSNDTINRAKAELLAAGFLYETCKGGRPNRASLYALTWYALDPCDKFDHDAAAVFRRGTYLDAGPMKNAGLTPKSGAATPKVAPEIGAATSPDPAHCTGNRCSSSPFEDAAAPKSGDHLEACHLQGASGAGKGLKP